MLKVHIEKITSNFEGTIVDIETIGDFSNYNDDDSRTYSELVPTIFGYITKNKLKILCAEGSRRSTSARTNQVPDPASFRHQCRS